jgi:hypothetical protein
VPTRPPGLTHCQRGAPQRHHDAEDKRRQRAGRRPLGSGGDGLAEDPRGAGGQCLFQSAYHVLHRPGANVHQAGQAEQGDQRREQRQEPVVGQAARGHAALVGGEPLPGALEPVPPPGPARLLRRLRGVGRCRLRREIGSVPGRCGRCWFCPCWFWTPSSAGTPSWSGTAMSSVTSRRSRALRLPPTMATPAATAPAATAAAGQWRWATGGRPGWPSRSAALSLSRAGTFRHLG